MIKDGCGTLKKEVPEMLQMQVEFGRKESILFHPERVATGQK